MASGIETTRIAAHAQAGNLLLRRAAGAWFLACMGALTGCTTPLPDPKLMTPPRIEVKTSHAYSVHVAVEGSALTGATDQAVLQALVATLQASKVFARVESAGVERVDFRLRVVVETASPPREEFTINKWLLANWRLTRGDSGAVVWQDFVTSRFTATPADAWGGIERTKFAIEGVVRENIRDGAARLSRLELR